MEKRYQVFVSSTYEDLKEERAKVITALLDMGHIPCGMEYFPAADEDAWNCIERLIPQCDYYVVLIAGKYGSIAPGGNKSYTHKEYELAVANQVPVLGLLHRNPNDLPRKLCEIDPKTQKKLDQFRAQVQRRLCRFWTSPDQIPGELLASLAQQINRIPRVGWVRADSVASEDAKSEIIQLRRALEASQKSLDQMKKVEEAAEGILASGDEEIHLRGLLSNRNSYWGRFGESGGYKREIDFDFVSTWNRILRFFAIREVVSWDEYSLKEILNESIIHSLVERRNFKSLHWDEYLVSWPEGEIRKVEIQFNALGLATYKSGKWHLTNKGIFQANRQLALRKGEFHAESFQWFKLQRIPGKPERRIPITVRLPIC